MPISRPDRADTRQRQASSAQDQLFRRRHCTGNGRRHRIRAASSGEQPLCRRQWRIFLRLRLFPSSCMRKSLQRNGDSAYLVMVDNPPQHPHGDFGLHGGRVTETPPNSPSRYRRLPALIVATSHAEPKAPLAPLLHHSDRARKSAANTIAAYGSMSATAAFARTRPAIAFALHPESHNIMSLAQANRVVVSTSNTSR